jgi:amino acid transporter
MQLLLPIHILAGGIGLIAGYVALFSAKGATLHRKTSLLFVVAIVTLSLTGALVAFLSASSISVVAGLLTFCFVTTALLTVRRRRDESLWIRVRQSLRSIASVSAPEAI